MGSLKEKTVKGIKWLLVASILQKALSFLTTIIIARRLGPSVYGLFAFAMVVVTSFELFKSLGVDAALIRKKEDFDKAANTAFFIIPSLGIILYLILILTAPWLGQLLNDRALVPVIRVLGLIFVITCFAKVPATVLERAMQFKYSFLVDSTCAVVFAVFAIIFTFLNFGIWALVFAYISKMLVYMTMVWLKAGWQPKFEFDKELAKEMLHFGKFVLLSSIVWFLKMNLDNLLVGKYLGATMLGFYAVAFNIANFGADYFGAQIYRVTYPAYSKLEGNLENMQSAFLKIFKYISLFAIPLGLGIFLLGGDFLNFVYGQKWTGAVGVLKVLAWAGIFNTLPISAGGIFLACNRPKEGFKITTIQVAIFFLFIAPAAKIFGLPGVGYVVSIASLTACWFAFYLVKKLLKLKLSAMVASIKPALAASLLMIIAIALFKYLLTGGGSPLLEHYRFIIVTAMAVLIYMYSLYKLEKPVFGELREMIFK